MLTTENTSRPQSQSRSRPTLTCVTFEDVKNDSHDGFQDSDSEDSGFHDSDAEHADAEINPWLNCGVRHQRSDTDGATPVTLSEKDVEKSATKPDGEEELACFQSPRIDLQATKTFATLATLDRIPTLDLRTLIPYKVVEVDEEADDGDDLSIQLGADAAAATANIAGTENFAPISATAYSRVESSSGMNRDCGYDADVDEEEGDDTQDTCGGGILTDDTWPDICRGASLSSMCARVSLDEIAGIWYAIDQESFVPMVNVSETDGKSLEKVSTNGSCEGVSSNNNNSSSSSSSSSSIISGRIASIQHKLISITFQNANCCASTLIDMHRARAVSKFFAELLGDICCDGTIGSVLVDTADPCAAVSFLQQLIRDNSRVTEIAKLPWNKCWAALSVEWAVQPYIDHFAAAAEAKIQAAIPSTLHSVIHSATHSTTHSDSTKLLYRPHAPQEIVTLSSQHLDDPAVDIWYDSDDAILGTYTLLPEITCSGRSVYVRATPGARMFLFYRNRSPQNKATVTSGISGTKRCLSLGGHSVGHGPDGGIAVMGVESRRDYGGHGADTSRSNGCGLNEANSISRYFRRNGSHEGHEGHEGHRDNDHRHFSVSVGDQDNCEGHTGCCDISGWHISCRLDPLQHPENCIPVSIQLPAAATPQLKREAIDDFCDVIDTLTKLPQLDRGGLVTGDSRKRLLQVLVEHPELLVEVDSAVNMLTSQEWHYVVRAMVRR